MTEQTQEQIREATARDLDLYDQYVEKEVVIEEDLGGRVSTARLERHGTQMVELTDYKNWNTSLQDVRTYEPMDDHNKIKPNFRMDKRTINKKDIASIQLLEDALNGKKYGDFFSE